MSLCLYNLEYAGQNDLRHRYFDLPARHIDANACVGISTPFDRGYEWVATTRVAYNYSHDRKENSLYRLDWIEEMADYLRSLFHLTQEGERGRNMRCPQGVPQNACI